jgi:heme exporter protein CcmD
MSNDPYFGFILAAYLIGLTVIAGMIVTILVDYANLKQRLARLSARTGSSIED